MEKSFRTNYRTAVEWLGNSYVLCNNIPEVDQSILDNARFSFFYYEDEDGNEYESEDDAPEGVEVYECGRDIFQWFVTDCSTDQVEYLEEHFGLLFTYSDALDCYILCVDHFGTSWDYVMIDTDLEYAARKEGERK